MGSRWKTADRRPEVSVWCGPQFGWIDLDPTNALLVEDDHIVIAIGRDYADVSPVDGVIFGGGKQQLDVSVDVKAVGEGGSSVRWL
jgi:transglutaminase-like putative cysteine protease